MSQSKSHGEQGYQVHFTGRHVQITEGMREHILDKIAKIEKFSHRIVDVSVIMDVEKHDHKVDIELRDGHTKIRAQGLSHDMYASIDQAIHKIQTQLCRYRDRLQKHHARNPVIEDISVRVYRSADEDVDEINTAIEEENEKRVEKLFRPHQVVSQETRPLKNLTDDEAIMKMELSGDHFQIYRSEETRKIRVIYRTDDGNYGIIEPE